VDLTSGDTGERRPPTKATGVDAGGRRRRESSACAWRQRDRRRIDEAERGGEALALAAGVRRQLDDEALPGRRHRLAVARAAEDRQDDARRRRRRRRLVAVAHRQPVWTVGAVAAAAVHDTTDQSHTFGQSGTVRTQISADAAADAGGPTAPPLIDNRPSRFLL